MRIGILGRTHLLYDSVRSLLEAGHEIAFIATCAAAPEYKRTVNDFLALSREIDVPFLETERINSRDALDFIEQHRADLGVSVNWCAIVGRKCRELFPHGIINVHLGDLPRYRGNATPNWAIINNESKTVLTLHLMAAELDAGPIVLQRDIPIYDDTYIGDVYDKAADITPSTLVEAAAGLEQGSIAPTPQDDDPKNCLRCYPRHPHDSEIDWRLPADQLCRIVRASSHPYSGAYTFVGTDKLTVWRAHVEPSPGPYLGTPGQVAEVRRKTGEVAVIAGGGFLILESATLSESAEAPAASVITSNRIRLGMDHAAEICRLRHLLEESNNNV